MSKYKVHIRSVHSDGDIIKAVEEIFQLCGAHEKITKDTSVVIKLNLSSIEKERIPASNTDPRVIAAVCGVLHDLGARMVLVEADGLRYTTEYAFDLNGTNEIAKRYGATTFNLSKDKMLYNCHPLLEGSGLPKTVLEAEFFITLPVLKTHALTIISGALKNQWGCVPRYDRILLHKHLDRLLAELNALFKPGLCLMDGIVAMEGRGPTSGTPKPCNLILGSTNPAALDATAARLMGLDPATVRHLVLYCEKELGSIREEDILIEPDLQKFVSPFEPARLDWPVALMNYLSRYPFFVHQILLNQGLFHYSRRLVNMMRKIGAA